MNVAPIIFFRDYLVDIFRWTAITLASIVSNRENTDMHFIPTYSSWLTQVERCFALVTDKAIRRGSFGSVRRTDVGRLKCFS